MRYLTFSILVIFLLVNHPVNSQITTASNGGATSEENFMFLKSVKQLDQFINRFNNEEDILTGRTLLPGEVKKNKIHADSFRLRRSMIIYNLFNHSSPYFKKEEAREFVTYCSEEKNQVHLSMNDENWYAEANCTFLETGTKKKIEIPIFLSFTGDNKKGYKWVLRGVPQAIFQLAKSDSTIFIGPMNQELNFIDLATGINFNSSNILNYFFEDYKYDNSSVFAYLIAQKWLRLSQVNYIKFHFFQVNGWYFSVSEFNRQTGNSGWLIQELSKETEEQKKIQKKQKMGLLQ